MKWTTKRPVVAGYYWFQAESPWTPAICQIVEVDGELRMYYFIPGIFEAFAPLAKVWRGVEWAGPILMPDRANRVPGKVHTEAIARAAVGIHFPGGRVQALR